MTRTRRCSLLAERKVISVDARGQATNRCICHFFQTNGRHIIYRVRFSLAYIFRDAYKPPKPDPARGECLVSRNRPAGNQNGNRIYRGKYRVGSLSRRWNGEGIFERCALSPIKLSALMTPINPAPYRTSSEGGTASDVGQPYVCGARVTPRRGEICNENHCDIACHKSLSVWCTANTGPVGSHTGPFSTPSLSRLILFFLVPLLAFPPSASDFFFFFFFIGRPPPARSPPSLSSSHSRPFSRYTFNQLIGRAFYGQLPTDHVQDIAPSSAPLGAPSAAPCERVVRPAR